MKMFAVARHELVYALKGPRSIILFAACLGLGFLMTANGSEFQDTASGGLVLVNSPFAVLEFLITVSVFSVVVVPIYFGDALLRDRHCRMDSVIFATPIEPGTFLWSRFLGALAALTLVLSGAPLGHILGSFWPGADPATLGPFMPLAYVQGFLLVLLPALVVAASIILFTAVWTRSNLACYVAALGLLFAYLITGESDVLPPVLDPFLFEVMEDLTRYWTAVERNQLLLPVAGPVLINRLLWLGFVAAVLWGARRGFRPRTTPTTARRVKRPIREDHAQPRSQGTRGVSRLDWSSSAYQLWVRTLFEVRQVSTNLPFLVLLALSGLLLLTGLLEREVMYGVDALPITRIMAGRITESLVWALLGILLFYSAEIIGRERKHQMNELIDALPTPAVVLLTAKVIALMTVMIAVMLLGIALAVAIQFLDGGVAYEPLLYFKKVMVHFTAQFLCLAILALFFQVLTNNRLLGMLAMFLFLGVTIGMIDGLGVEHPLLRYGLAPMGARLSDMNGAGRFEQATHWHLAYWSAWALLLLQATALLWQRGLQQPPWQRRDIWNALRSPKWGVPLSLTLAAMVGSAGVIYHNTNILEPYQTSRDLIDARVTYEQKYRRYADLPMPRTVAVDLEVDLYPHDGRVEVRGTHRLRNKTSGSLDQVHLVFPGDNQVAHVTLEGGRLKQVDHDFNYYIFHLAEPMAVGEERLLAFEAVMQQQGFSHDRPDTRLVRNGTFLHNNHLTPYVGFNPKYLLEDAAERRKRGLPPLPRTAPLEDVSQHHHDDLRGDSDFLELETIVSTEIGQTAVGVGRLVRKWEDGDRAYFHYRAEAPIRNLYAFLSARYEVVRDRWREVEIEVYHHPGHETNVPRMIAGVKDGLDYFSSAFSPYQYDHLRIMEFPCYRPFAQSMPGMIPYSEAMGFVADVGEDDIDMPYYVTVHEVAHQWWGHQLAPANTQGASFLMESLSQYSALMVMERRYGRDQIHRFLELEMDRYLAGRSDDPVGEVPLIRAEGQEYIHYHKGSLVMYALRDYLGEAVVNGALRQLLEEHAYRSEPYTLSSDFLRILKQQAGPEYHSLIDDLLVHITLFDTRVDAAEVKPLPDGGFEVAMKLTAKSFRADPLGNQQEIAMALPVEIGLFEHDPKRGSSTGESIIHLEKYLVPADGELIIQVPRRPTWVGIDPHHKLIDRDLSDNLLEL